MNKKLVLSTLFIILLIVFLTSGVYANYQSIGTGTGVLTKATTWMTGIRQMESSGKGMGLNETINTTTRLATTESNNIDVHMLKNTEYGAILLLGASDYGKQGSSITARRMDKGATTGTEVQASTTGNKYGIYEMGYYNMNVANNNQWEWVAGAGYSESQLKNVAPRYINRYTGSYTSQRNGDATYNTRKWHGSSYDGWSGDDDYGFVRGNNGVFSYYSGNSYSMIYYESYYARAGVVCGTGF